MRLGLPDTQAVTSNGEKCSRARQSGRREKQFSRWGAVHPERDADIPATFDNAGNLTSLGDFQMGARDPDRPTESSGTDQVLLCALMLGALGLVLMTSDPVVHSRSQADLAPVADCISDSGQTAGSDQDCGDPMPTGRDDG